jgi:penicillin-binding protein 1C
LDCALRIQKNLKWLVGFLVVAIAVTLACGFLLLPSLQQIRSSTPPSHWRLLDAEGGLQETLRVDFKREQAQWIAFEDIPPHLVNAILQQEDKRIYRHPGVDFVSLAGAAKDHLFQEKNMRGASTLAMQNIRLLYPLLRKQPAIVRKTIEFALAPLLTMRLGRQGIIEVWVNLVPLPGGCAGFPCFFPENLQANEDEIREALAAVRQPGKHLFSKSKPNASKFVSLQKEPYLLTSLQQKRLFGQEKALGISFERGTFQTMLNPELQSQLKEYGKAESVRLRKDNVTAFAVVVLENATGHFIGHLGNVPNQETPAWIDNAFSLRQAGSTLKPFLYAESFDRNILHPDTLLQDKPYEKIKNGASWRPQNYNQTFHGPISAKVALASSLNVPAVRVVDLLGVSAFAKVLEKFGFTLHQPPEWFGESLALGTLDVSLFELTRAYQMWAQKLLSGDESSQSGWAQAAKALASAQNRALTFGLDSPLRLPFPAAVKTGTSVDMRDNWCVGFDAYHTVGVWAGNENGSPMWDVSGVEGAAPLWHDVMTWLRGSRQHPHQKSNRTHEQKVYAERLENILDNESWQQREHPSESALAKAVIVSPAAGSTYGRDPEIPANEEKIVWLAEGDLKESQWFLNGKFISDAMPAYAWSPTPGNHRLALMREGELLSQNDFVVK